jgi:hypothetical protein
MSDETEKQEEPTEGKLEINLSYHGIIYRQLLNNPNRGALRVQTEVLQMLLVEVDKLVKQVSAVINTPNTVEEMVKDCGDTEQTETLKNDNRSKNTTTK